MNHSCKSQSVRPKLPMFIRLQVPLFVICDRTFFPVFFLSYGVYKLDRRISVYVPPVMLNSRYFVQKYLSWIMDKHMLSHKIDFVIINPLSYPSLFMFRGDSRLSLMFTDWRWGFHCEFGGSVHNICSFQQIFAECSVKFTFHR